MIDVAQMGISECQVWTLSICATILLFVGLLVFGLSWSVSVARRHTPVRLACSNASSHAATIAQVLEPLEVGLDINTFTKSVDNSRVYDGGRCARALCGARENTNFSF